MFCNSTHPQVRAQTAELFAKMTADKLIGPKVSTKWVFRKKLIVKSVTLIPIS